MKCLNIFCYKHKNTFLLPSVIYLKKGEEIPFVQLFYYFITKCIFQNIMHCHVSYFEHQKNIALYPWWDSIQSIKTLYNANPLILQSRPIL